MHKELYKKYRPTSLEKVYGNSSLLTTLKGMLKNGLPHSLLFHGETGSGKTSIARILAKELNCADKDLIEIDSGQFRGIDTIREIRKNIQYTPIGGSVTVYILDEFHKSTSDAQNATLKILEDTPDHVYFILCTTDTQKLLPAIRNRCSQYQVSLLNEDDMSSLISYVVKKEKDTLDKKVLKQIILDSLGHPREALQILHQVLVVPKKKRLEVAKRKAMEQSVPIELCRALGQRKNWNVIKDILKGLKGQDPEGIRRIVLGYATAVLLNKNDSQYAVILEEFTNPFYDSGFPQLVLACYTVIQN